MIDFSWSHLVVVAVVALIVIGPKELPSVLRSLGYWMGKVRSMAAEFQSQFQEAMREAEMADLKTHADDLNEATRALTGKFDSLDLLEKTAGAPARPTAATDAASAGEAAPPAASETGAPAPVAPAENAASEVPAEITAPEAPAARAGGA